jgi:hypothetical protein
MGLLTLTALIYYFLLFDRSVIANGNRDLLQPMKYCAAPWSWGKLWRISTSHVNSDVSRLARQFLTVGVLMFGLWLAFGVSVLTSLN